MTDALLSRLDDLEAAFVDCCREVRSLLVAADHERALLQARLEELRAVLSGGAARAVPEPPPSVVVVPAPVVAEPASVPRRRTRAYNTRTCERCPNRFEGSSKRRYCDDCFRQLARERMAKRRADGTVRVPGQSLEQQLAEADAITTEQILRRVGGAVEQG